MGLSSGDLQKQKYISGTIHRTKKADHFLETPEYKQSKNLGLVYLKGAESVKRMTSNISFTGWLVRAPPHHIHAPTPSQTSWIRPWSPINFVG